MASDIIEQVALVTGRILHQGTGEPIIGSVRITAREGLVADKLLADGTFVVSGRPELLFPNLDSQDYRLNLNIRVDSAQYRQGSAEKQQVVDILMGSAFDTPVDIGTIPLAADPVNIRGRVVKAVDPDIPINGAKVKVLQSGVVTNSTTTDLDGRYKFDDIPVLALSEIRCSKTGFKTQKRTLIIDFGKLVNEEYFRLAPP